LQKECVINYSIIIVTPTLTCEW